jgi:predicted membrane channel-forming protein YqfA (hemolysin III family)
MNQPNTKPNGWAASNARNTVNLAYWTGAWVASQALAVFGPAHLWHASQTPTALALLINVVMGIGMIMAFRRHLNGLDELQRRIQLEAMALCLGVGLVAGMAYSTLAVTKLIGFEAKISHLVILMGLTYLAGVLRGHRKYQ